MMTKGARQLSNPSPLQINGLRIAKAYYAIRMTGFGKAGHFPFGGSDR